MSRSRSRGWFQKHSRDPYVRQARAAQYRARSAYKLQELDKREKLFKPGQTVIDLGAAPGSWAQYVAGRIRPKGITVTDQANMVELAQLLSTIARRTLKPGGHFLIKLFQGAELNAYVAELREHFREVVNRKPLASKDASREVYVLARGYNV